MELVSQSPVSRPSIRLPPPSTLSGRRYAILPRVTLSILESWAARSDGSSSSSSLSSSSLCCPLIGYRWRQMHSSSSSSPSPCPLVIKRCSSQTQPLFGQKILYYYYYMLLLLLLRRLVLWSSAVVEAKCTLVPRRLTLWQSTRFMHGHWSVQCRPFDGSSAGRI